MKLHLPGMLIASVRWSSAEALWGCCIHFSHVLVESGLVYEQRMTLALLAI